MRIGTNETGFVKVASAMPRVTPGAPQKNAESILVVLKKASAEQVDLLVFPELCLTGYTAADLFVRAGVLARTEAALQTLLQKMREMATQTIVVLGLPLRVEGRLYNAALFCQNGRPLAVVPKSYLPAYQEFYEPRWFSPASEAITREVTLGGMTVPFGTDIIVESASGLRVAAEICEDLWVACPPGVRHAAAGANVIVNLSASDDTTGKANFRRDLVKMASARSSCAYVYSSSGQGESTTDLVFSGHLLIAAGGRIANEWKWDKQWINASEQKFITAIVDLERIELERIRFRTFSQGIAAEALRNYRHVKADATPAAHEALWPDRVDATPFIPKTIEAKCDRAEKILRMQARALAVRLESLRKANLNRVVIGISGGLDSTLALLAISRAFELLDLPKTHIEGISMPGFGTSQQTKTNAEALMKALFGKSLREIDIRQACLQHFKDIGHDEKDLSVTYENAQARERTQILMDIANKEGAIVVGTSDMSELALGWATFNGDHMSMYAINAGIPKTLVKTIVEAEANRRGGAIQTILKRICETEISPELLPPDSAGKIQSTEGTIGRYALHDFFLFHLMRNGFSRERIVKLAKIAFMEENITAEEIDKTAATFFRRFYTQQFKRSSMPDGPKIGSVALSPRGDLRLPSDLGGVEPD